MSFTNRHGEHGGKGIEYSTARRTGQQPWTETRSACSSLGRRLALSYSQSSRSDRIAERGVRMFSKLMPVTPKCVCCVLRFFLRMVFVLLSCKDYNIKKQMMGYIVDI